MTTRIMTSRIVNGVKYVALMNDNNLKLKSLNDCVYYTLRDIFWNVDYEYYKTIMELNSLLIDEKKAGPIEYKNVFDDLDSIKKLYGFFTSIEESYFEFVDEPFDKEDDYIKYDVWWEQLQQLNKQLREIMDDKMNHGCV